MCQVLTMKNIATPMEGFLSFFHDFFVSHFFTIDPQAKNRVWLSPGSRFTALTSLYCVLTIAFWLHFLKVTHSNADPIWKEMVSKLNAVHKGRTVSLWSVHVRGIQRLQPEAPRAQPSRGTQVQLRALRLPDGARNAAQEARPARAWKSAEQRHCANSSMIIKLISHISREI